MIDLSKYNIIYIDNKYKIRVYCIGYTGKLEDAIKEYEKKYGLDDKIIYVNKDNGNIYVVSEIFKNKIKRIGS